jgi:hypothetical protein
MLPRTTHRVQDRRNSFNSLACRIVRALGVAYGRDIVARRLRVCIYSKLKGSATIWIQASAPARRRGTPRCWSIMTLFWGRPKGDLTVRNAAKSVRLTVDHRDRPEMRKAVGMDAPESAFGAMALRPLLHPVDAVSATFVSKPCDPTDTPVSGFVVTRAHRWTSAPATTATATSTSALGNPTSITGRSVPLAGSRNRSSTLLISVGALPSAPARSGSQRKSGAGAAPMAWRPLFTRITTPVKAANANVIALQREPATATGLRNCCNRASQVQSQLLGGLKYAYTPPNQDSATIHMLKCFNLGMTALSPANVDSGPGYEAEARGRRY